MSVLTILREARECYAAAPSHAPYGEGPEPGTVCAATACGFSAEYPAAVRGLARAAGLDCGDYMTRSRVIQWNADASTAEVLAAFDKAIAAEEAKS